MNPLGFDTETALIRPGLLAPPLVCLTWQRPGLPSGIEAHRESEPRIAAWLADPSTMLVGHNVAYDLAVIGARFPGLIPAIFAAYKADRVTDTMLRAYLLDIAAGTYRGTFDQRGKWVEKKYSLADLAKRYAGLELQKDGWRMSYAEFLDVPIADWVEHAKTLQAKNRPRLEELRARVGLTKEEKQELADLIGLVESAPEQCIIYPKHDAEATLAVYLAQEKHAAYLKDQYRQARAAWALHLSSAWGLRTHAAGVASLAKEIEEALADIEEELTDLGLVRPDGSRDTKRAKALMIQICKDNGLPLRRTDSHFADSSGNPCPEGDECTTHVCLDADACAAVTTSPETGAIPEAEPLAMYAELTTLKKMQSNDVAMLQAGTTHPVHTRYGMAETGRTTSSKPNIQNLNTGRAKNKSKSSQLRVGIRQAFIPRPGKVFAQGDYPQGELYTLAQCCIKWVGFSKLGDALNAGMDPHLMFAARVLGITYEEASANKKRKDVDHARQVGKVFNFGKPGGLGDAKLILFARKTYGVELTPDQVKPLTEQWLEEFPEMRHHFARVNVLCENETGKATVETLFTERTRGRTSYCAACNNGFQALLADCAKRAAFLIAEAQYVDRKSPLFGSRTVAFVHDEFIVETDDSPGAHDAAFELARLMVEGANAYLPDVPIKLDRMEPTLMRCWSKEAKQVWNYQGRLVPWQPAT